MAFNFSYLKQIALLALIGSAYAIPAPQVITTFSTVLPGPGDTVETMTVSSSGASSVKTITFDPPSAFPTGGKTVTVTETVCSVASGVVSSFSSVAPGTVVSSFTSVAPGTIESSITTVAPRSIVSSFTSIPPESITSSFTSISPRAVESSIISVDSTTFSASGPVTSIISSAPADVTTVVISTVSCEPSVVTSVASTEPSIVTSVVTSPSSAATTTAGGNVTSIFISSAA